MTTYDDNDPAWPPRCRGFLGGMSAAEKLANCELAALRAEVERYRSQKAEAARLLNEEVKLGERKDARIAQLEAALTEMLDDEMLSYLEYSDEFDDQRYQVGVRAGAIRRAAAALKGDADDNESG